jgi:hypothetical protein
MQKIALGAQRVKTINIKLDRQQKFEITKEGFIKVKARLTRTGVFDYWEDGSKVRYLRPEEEVFNPESLKTLELKPVTFYHPTDLVNNQNINKYQVGTIGQDIVRDGDFIQATLLITHKSAVDYIKDKFEKNEDVELSCGYEVREEKQNGTHKKDGDYQKIQRDIRYNHISIVPKGRAGSEVKLLLDEEYNNKNNNNGVDMDKPADNKTTVEIKLDAEMQKKLDSMQEEVEKTKKDAAVKLDEMQAKFDAIEAENKKLNDELKIWKDPESKEVKSMLDAHNKVLDVAKKFKIDCNDKTAKDLKIECIKKTDESFDATKKSDDYINARFDACESFLKFEAENKQKLELNAIANVKNDGCKEPKKDEKNLESYSKKKRTKK